MKTLATIAICMFVLFVAMALREGLYVTFLIFLISGSFVGYQAADRYLADNRR